MHLRMTTRVLSFEAVFALYMLRHTAARQRKGFEEQEHNPARVAG
jgi:hypothetical protein